MKAEAGGYLEKFYEVGAGTDTDTDRGRGRRAAGLVRGLRAAGRPKLPRRRSLALARRLGRRAPAAPSQPTQTSRPTALPPPDPQRRNRAKEERIRAQREALEGKGAAAGGGVGGGVEGGAAAGARWRRPWRRSTAVRAQAHAPCLLTGWLHRIGRRPQATASTAPRAPTTGSASL